MWSIAIVASRSLIPSNLWTLQKWMRHRGFRPRGIQTGPFAACQTDFVPKNVHLFPASHNKPFLITPERGRKELRKEHGLKIGKYNNEWDTGFFLPWCIQTGPFGACQTDFVPKHFHLFTRPPIITKPFLITPERGRKEGAGAENWEIQKWMRHRFFLPWCIQTGPFAAWQTDFVPKHFHLFTQPPIINQWG